VVAARCQIEAEAPEGVEAGVQAAHPDADVIEVEGDRAQAAT